MMASPLNEALMLAERISDEGHDHHLIHQLRKALREAADQTSGRVFDAACA